MSEPPRTVIVSAGVILQNGRVLCSRRKAGAHLAGLLEFPGGKVEPGEDPRAALVRELREELGVEVTVGEILDVTFHRYEEANKAVLLLFFEAELTASSPAPTPLEVAEIVFLSAAELAPEHFPPADVPLLRKLRTRLANSPGS